MWFHYTKRRRSYLFLIALLRRARRSYLFLLALHCPARRSYFINDLLETKRHRIISTDSKFHRQTSVLTICRVSSFVFLVLLIWFLYFWDVNLPASKKIVQKITITISVLTAEIYRGAIELIFCTVDSMIIAFVSICFLRMRREQIIFLCCERWSAFFSISPSRSVFKHWFEQDLFKVYWFLIQVCSLIGKPTVFSAFYCKFIDVDSRAVNMICHCIMCIW
jgi:hypothetical protein